MTVTLDFEYDSQEWWGEVRMNGEVLTLDESLKVARHSPDGFSWGYAGSGPSQLALAILLRHGVRRSEAVRMCPFLVAEVIARIPMTEFKLDIDLDAWIRDHRSH